MIREENNYFLSFFAGSQGRFLNLAIKALLENNFDTYRNSLGEFNCWHVNDHRNNYFKDDYFNNDPIKFYNLVQFPAGKYLHYRNGKIITVNSIMTHLYPDWSILSQRRDLSAAKIIIIKIDQSSKLEIHSNIVYKNFIRELMLGNFTPGTNNRLNELYRIFQDHYGVCEFNEFVQSITTNFDHAQQVIKSSFDRPNWTVNQRFVDCELDADLLSRILVVDYRDLFTRSSQGYLALNQISKFFGVTVSDSAVDFFNFNDQNRSAMIKNCMYNLDIS